MLYPQINKTRQIINLDGFWRFKRDNDDVGEKDEWFKGLSEYREIGVPGSWNEQYTDMFDYFGKVWYEKQIVISSMWKDKSIWIRVGDACTNAKVWINGCYMGEHRGGHLPFEFDISSAALFDETNTISICVDNTLDPFGLPPAVLQKGEGRVGFTTSKPAVTYDFYPYGGLHRSVLVYMTGKLRVEDIVIKTNIEDDYEKATVSCSIKLNREFSGTISAESAGIKKCIPVDGKDKVTVEFEVDKPVLWDIDNPKLYELYVEVFEGEALVDSYNEPYGIRSIKVVGNDIMLNNKKIFLKGFGKHEDFHILGKGFNPCIVAKDFELMKQLGANSFRTSHYPYCEEMLYLADRTGMLIIDETPFVGLNSRMFRDDILERAKVVIKELVSRDKNHPSVIMWSMANEPNVSTPEGEEFFKEMQLTAREMDDTRPITYVAHMEPDNNLGMKYYDVVCINKYYGWYISPGDIDGTLEGLSDCLDRFYNAFKKPVMLTEFGADAIEGMHNDTTTMFTEEFQSEIIEKQYKVLRSKEYAAGAHVWCFADFKANQTTSRVVYNRKGVFTRDRKPKMAARMLKKLWNE